MVLNKTSWPWLLRNLYSSEGERINNSLKINEIISGSSRCYEEGRIRRDGVMSPSVTGYQPDIVCIYTGYTEFPADMLSELSTLGY